MATCKDCIHYEVCSGYTLTDLDKDVFHYAIEGRADEIPDIEERCGGFKDKSRYTELPCKVGDTAYKICPKCNKDHNGSCERCAWRGCHYSGCDVGVRVWCDGSYNEHELQIVPYKVTEERFVTIIKYWNIMFFSTAEEAETAKAEYDTIRKIEDRHERYEAYKAWEEKREINYTFLKGADNE